MDPDVTPKPEKTQVSLKKLLTPFKKLPTALNTLLTPLKKVPTAFTNLLTPLKKVPTALTTLLTPLKKIATAPKNLPIPKQLPTAPENLPVHEKLPSALKKLPIPKKLLIPAIAGVALLAAGGAFGLLHARLSHAVASPVKVAATAQAAPTTAPSAACSGVVRDIYRQTVIEDPSVTLAEIRSEVLSSGVNCAPVPEIAAKLKDLSPACRDMVQYTFLEVRDGHPDITVNDIRPKVVQKSVACEHDRSANIASVARQKAK